MSEPTKVKPDMPPFPQRRYQKKSGGKNNSNWRVIDTHNNNAILLKGYYESVVRACHMYNEEHYQKNPFVTSEGSPV